MSLIYTYSNSENKDWIMCKLTFQDHSPLVNIKLYYHLASGWVLSLDSVLLIGTAICIVIIYVILQVNWYCDIHINLFEHKIYYLVRP